jgi:hypothetical protein
MNVKLTHVRLAVSDQDRAFEYLHALKELIEGGCDRAVFDRAYPPG